MDRSQILHRLGEIITDSSTEELDWSNVTEETSLETFGVDSLVVLDLIFDLEDVFGAKIESADMLQMKTAGDLVTFIENQLS